MMQESDHPPALRAATALTLLLALLIVLPLLCATTGCVTKRRIYDSQGVLVDEQTIVNRPVKKFFKNVEME